MKDLDSANPDPESPKAAADLAKRLTRFRRRVEAEGRQKSARLIEKAIENLAADGADPKKLRDNPDIDGAG